ncbi:hypothetical protein A5320_10230 [Rheinheimera sp. SA_1]|uniref:DUF2271 domain-containing protein n=1 Tax=Rheinheimera sp. SA_1 TaxID=1827365 RepID=UPI0007FD22D4|nr:DUF2271 domain-containing protein [Rheinheimera sp. SA_1]OBP15681.1 hypothetical protein A5320_10230 [Rheinheimera sp. SA_1]
MLLPKPNTNPNNRQSQRLCCGLLGLVVLVGHPVSAGPTLRWQQPAFGATLQLELQGVSTADFARQQRQLQQKITLLSQQLDTSLADSALSQLNQQGVQPAPDSALASLLTRCEHWYQQTRGFSCRLGSIHQQWQRAQLQGQLPDRVALRQQSRQLQHPPPEVAMQNRHIHWNFRGLEQAFLLDELRKWCQQLFPQSSQLKLQLGDVTVIDGVAGAVTLPWQINNSNTAALLDLSLQQVALAYSKQQGGYQLSYRNYSPLLHPSEGWPVEYGPQVAVVATTAVDAWLLAQSLAVLPKELHPPLLAGNNGKTPAAALMQITTATSTVLQPSTQWYSWLAEQQRWQPQAAMQLKYQIRPQAAAAKRPYLAIWVSTKEQQLVRQLSLQGQQARWYQELRQWWRRIGKPAQLALDSLAGATRKAGSYQLEWDGRDEQGRPVPPGEYVLHLEIAREHGEHEKLSLPLQFTAGSNGKTNGRFELGDIQWQVKSTQIVQASSSRSNQSR